MKQYSSLEMIRFPESKKNEIKSGVSLKGKFYKIQIFNFYLFSDQELLARYTW